MPPKALYEAPIDDPVLGWLFRLPYCEESKDAFYYKTIKLVNGWMVATDGNWIRWARNMEDYQLTSEEGNCFTVEETPTKYKLYKAVESALFKFPSEVGPPPVPELMNGLTWYNRSLMAHDLYSSRVVDFDLLACFDPKGGYRAVRLSDALALVEELDKGYTLLSTKSALQD